MQYYAKTYTADPRVGLISVGEVLTRKQVDVLGAEKIAELVQRGVLVAVGGNDPASEPDDPASGKEEGSEKTTADPETDPDADKDDGGDEEITDPDAGEDGGKEEALPELDAMDDIVRDETEKPKKGGRRKAK